jgi:hypothetical protein
MMRMMILTILMLSFITACGQDQERTERQIELKPFDFSFKEYAGLLDKYVVGKRVDYIELQKSATTLDSVVASFKTADLSEASDNQKTAFYINAYNAITLKSIIDEYPVGSIKDIEGVWDDIK